MFKKVKCNYCSKMFKKKVCVAFADRFYCSSDCMSNDFRDNMTTDELIELNVKDTNK